MKRKRVALILYVILLLPLTACGGKGSKAIRTYKQEAALMMMASKIILQSCAMLGGSPAEVLTKTNEAICSNNQEEMFVTVWLVILEISTGKLTAANAGHEYPVLQRRRL